MALLKQKIFNPLLEFLLPRRCMMCRNQLGAIEDSGHEEKPSFEGALCISCWSDVTFLTTAKCPKCAHPYDIDFSENTLDVSNQDLTCGKCLKDPPLFQSTTSAVLYDDHSKEMILKFKHGDATYFAPLFASWIINIDQLSTSPILKKSDLIVPVPLHWTRLFKRQYNQASLLANALSKQSSLPVENTLLKRTKATQSQGHLSPEERTKNVSGKFAIQDKNKSFVKEKVITLVDDVYTSGATVRACAKELLRAGAKDVHVLTLARVGKL